MGNRKSCVKCGRSIDEFARVCPFCNWWQSEPVPAQQPGPAPAEQVAAFDPRARKGVLGGIAFGLLLIVAFAIGAFLRGSEPATGARPEANAAAQPSSRVSVKLIPVTEGAPPPVSDSPITTIPTQGTTTTLGPSDLTALPSDQYAAAAARMRTAEQQATGSVIDPRSITGSPYVPPAQPARSRAVAEVQTQPIPVFQPVPHVRVDREQTAQLSLVVGTDGRVHDIDIQRDVPGVMGPLIGSVQQWRFRPAMQNGEPVSSRFTVAVTFRP
jgi:hypothetical protein